MRDILISLDLFQEIKEIELSNIPNQEFNININNKEYKIELRTFTDDVTYITITKDSKTLLNLGNIKTNINLLFLSGDNIAMFFLESTNVAKIRPYNYLDFTNKIRLYYATF